MRHMRRRKRKFPLPLRVSKVQLKAQMNVNTRVEAVVEEVEATTVANSASTTLTMKDSRLYAMRKLTISTILPAGNVVEEVVTVVASEEIEGSTEVEIVEIVATAAEAEEEDAERDLGLNVSTEVVETSGGPNSMNLLEVRPHQLPLSHNPPHSRNE